MKFYKDNYRNKYIYWCKIKDNKLTAIYYDSIAVRFFKNGNHHNTKNAAYINNGYKEFLLNDKFYDKNKDVTKQSWRRFVKLQAFI
jgi:hypothetical protein